ncbi:MAG: archaellar assembly protein FlaJ [Chloroflexi bacterium]|nr:archaellar assembly protein FlaJ [Chloroflexota bacterium]
MIFSRLWRRSNGRASSNPELLAFDLLFQLSYMSAIAASGISRKPIFERAARLNVASAHYFNAVNVLPHTLNYDYAAACRLIGETTRETEVKNLLLRLSAALASGQRDSEFWAQEAHIQADAYGNDYDRQLETLRKWSDAYIALLISMALVMIVAVVSMVLYRVGNALVLGLTGTTAGIALLGGWILYRAAPREIKPLAGATGARGQERCRRLFSVLSLACLAVCAVLWLLGAPPGWLFVAAGAVLMPIGVVTGIYDRRVGRKDEDISVFLRSLGRTASAIGTTVVEALGRIDLRAMNSLAPEIKALRTRLQARINPDLCWWRFVVETESEIISRSVRTFQDAIALGGDPDEVGSRSALFATRIAQLRAKRRLVAAQFGPLCLIMHGTITALLVFVIEIVGTFGKAVQSVSLPDMSKVKTLSTMSILSFNPQDIQFFYTLLIPMFLLLSVVNAFAPKVAGGGHNYIIFFYLGITLVASGASLLVMPIITQLIFKVAAA